jgi:hypothetical protein
MIYKRNSLEDILVSFRAKAAKFRLKYLLLLCEHAQILWTINCDMFLEDWWTYAKNLSRLITYAAPV